MRTVLKADGRVSSRFHANIQILFFPASMMILREAGFTVVETIGGQGSAQEDLSFHRKSPFYRNRPDSLKRAPRTASNMRLKERQNSLMLCFLRFRREVHLHLQRNRNRLAV
jgi:ATP-dependent helicase YprA (DUF1998 family)